MGAIFHKLYMISPPPPRWPQRQGEPGLVCAVYMCVLLVDVYIIAECKNYTMAERVLIIANEVSHSSDN